ncbi:transcriptional repressor [Gammaproteobacteria bacterium]|nr:transcriptional repressor [Gammaproteobacteria bacterium]
MPDHHHDHMVCMETGKVIEFEDDIIEERQHQLAKKNGYKIVDHSMVLFVEPIEK